MMNQSQGSAYNYNYPYSSNHHSNNAGAPNPLLLKIDTKQKIKYIRGYLNQLKTTQPSMQYLTINCTECGFYDFDYVTRRRRTITDIEKDLKDNKYQTVKQICQQLKNLYGHLAQYLLLNDPLQEQIARLMKQVGEFQSKFAEDFKQNRLNKQITPKFFKKEDQTAKPHKQKQDIPPNNTNSNPLNPNNLNVNTGTTKIGTAPIPIAEPVMDFNRKSTFSQKLQMFFYLRTHQDNMQYIKSIGDGYSIGKQEIQGDYSIKLEAGVSGCLWLELLQKKDM